VPIWQAECWSVRETAPVFSNDCCKLDFGRTILEVNQAQEQGSKQNERGREVWSGASDKKGQKSYDENLGDHESFLAKVT